MFRTNNVKNEQISLLSKMNEWSNYKTKLLKNSWAETFRNVIMPNIDEEPYKVLYSDISSRPNTPVNYLIGLLIIKSLMGLSDEELINAAFFDEKIQYALGTLDYINQPISKNMISNFRVRLYEYNDEAGIDLFENTMKELNDNIVEISKVNKTLKRVDSLMISSSCKRMTRTELIYKVNERFIKLLNKSGEKLNDEYKKYLDEDNEVDVLYRVKEEELTGKLTMLLNQSISLYKKYKHNKKYNETIEFKQLERLISEQYDDKENKPKSGKEIKPTSMQTPYDEKATYRFKYKGNIGYVGNIVETIDTEKEVALITDWDLAPNVKSDLEFMQEIIEEKKENEIETKETYITDAAYFSGEVNEQAKEANIELHPTDMTGKKDIKETNLANFELDENKNIIECPNGKKPIESKYCESNDTIYATFDKESCKDCPNIKKCPIRLFKKINKLTVSTKQIETAKVKEGRNTNEYKELSRKRSGIEGINSLLRYKYHIDRRQTKGLAYLTVVFTTSILSINIKRITKINKIVNNNA